MEVGESTGETTDGRREKGVAGKEKIGKERKEEMGEKMARRNEAGGRKETGETRRR